MKKKLKKSNPIKTYLILGIITLISIYFITIFAKNESNIDKSTLKANEENLEVISNTETNSINDFVPFDLPIYTYHFVGENKSSDPIYNVSLQAFERQLQEIVYHDFTSITFEDVINHIQKGAALPEKPIILVFNNSAKSQYTNAFPLLKKYNLKASFGIVTSWQDKSEEYLTWDEVKEMKNAGMEIVSHTVDHADLANLSELDLEFELKESKRIIDENLSQDTKTLVYSGVTITESMKNKASESGYILAKTTKDGSLVIKDNLLDLQSFNATEETVIK